MSQRTNGRNRAVLEALLLFVIALAIALGFFWSENRHLHEQMNSIDRIACLKDRQIAANQRRVILALIELEREEREHLNLKMDGVMLQKALRNVPDFQC